MCPFCLTTVGLVVAGVVSTGGLTALVVKLSHKRETEKVEMDLSGKGNDHVKEK
jgi:hypothetical protein